MKKGLKTFSLNARKSVRLLVALAAVCTLGLFNSAQAQDAAAADTTNTSSKLTIGVRAGLNLNRMRIGGTTENSNTTPGAQLGAFVHYQFNNWVGESLEVAWSQSGTGNFVGERNKRYTFYLNNVQINALSYFKLPVLSVYEPKVFIGPSFNINPYSIAQVEGPAIVGPQHVKYRVDVTNNFKALDFGIIVGTGVDFDLKFAKLMIDARYRHGITDIGVANNNSFLSPYGSTGNRSVRTNQVSVQVGLGFSL